MLGLYIPALLKIPASLHQVFRLDDVAHEEPLPALWRTADPPLREMQGVRRGRALGEPTRPLPAGNDESRPSLQGLAAATDETR